MAQRPIVPAGASRETLDAAANFSRRNASAKEIVGGSRALQDEHSDDDRDAVNLELDGRSMMEIGKYKGQKTLEQVYADDKNYIQCVRSHKKGTQMSSGLLRLKTYVELRDVSKHNREAAKMMAREQTVSYTGQKPKGKEGTSRNQESAPTQSRATDGSAWSRQPGPRPTGKR